MVTMLEKVISYVKFLQLSSSTIGTGRRDKVMRPRELLEEAPILL
jgi:hypothetical protein